MIQIAYADAAAATTTGGMGSTILMIVLMIAIFYFLMIRPENKRKKQAEEMRSSSEEGRLLTTTRRVRPRRGYHRPYCGHRDQRGPRSRGVPEVRYRPGRYPGRAGCRPAASGEEG